MFTFRKKEQEKEEPSSNAKLSQPEINKILRTVSDDEAFYFYEELGKPTGQVATSILDFRNKVSGVKWSSVIFHLKRKDFENWVKFIIKDEELAKKISLIRPDDFDPRSKLHETVDARIKELNDMLDSATITEDVSLVQSESQSQYP